MPRVHLPDGRVVNFPDTMAPGDIEREVSKLAAEPVETASNKPPPVKRGYVGTGPGGYGIVDNPSQYVAEQSKAHEENLPTYGALAATALTSGAALPGILAAGGGGAAGKALQHGLRGESPLNADVPGAGVEQAAYEAGGRVIGPAVREIGTGIYNLGLSPARKLAQGFGGARKIAQTVMDAGAWLPGSKRFGVAPVNAARAASSKEATAALAGTLPPGARIRTDVPLKELGELRRNVRSPEKVVDLAAIDAFEKNVRAGHPQGFTAEELEAFKQGAQNKASTHYRAVEKGMDPAGQITADANAAVGKGAREFLEKLSPAVKPINERTTALIGGQRAMEDVVGRSNLARMAAVGTTAWYNPKAAAAAALMLPQVGGPAGFATYHAGKALGRARLPDVARVIEMLQRQEQIDQLGSER